MHRHAYWSNSLENRAAVDLGRAALKWVEAADGSLEATLFILHSPGPLGALGVLPVKFSSLSAISEA